MSAKIKLRKEQDRAIKELEARVKNVLTPKLLEDPTLFYRFLKARNFDVDNAEKMLRKHITWRKVYQVDTILENFKPKEFFIKYIRPCHIGFDKEGNIASYIAVGNIDADDVFKCWKTTEMNKHWIWFAEKSLASLDEHNKKTVSNAQRGTLIMDLDKLTFGNATNTTGINDLLLRCNQIYQDNYPERMQALFVINAPHFYAFAYGIIKSVMSTEMLKKIYVYGYSGWKEKLLEHFDGDVLPAFLGGNRTDQDGDPLCKSFISFGGEIPEKYILSENERHFKDRTQVKKIILRHSVKQEIYVNVEKAGMFIQWEFLVKKYDIGFGLFFQGPEQVIQEIIPVQKYCTPDGTVRDSYKSHSAGTYIVVFDNSYSWIHCKEVEYCVTVMQPSNDYKWNWPFNVI